MTLDEIIRQLIDEYGYKTIFEKLQRAVDIESLEAEDVKRWDDSRQWDRLSSHLESCISYCPKN